MTGCRLSSWTWHSPAWPNLAASMSWTKMCRQAALQGFFPSGSLVWHQGLSSNMSLRRSSPTTLAGCRVCCKVRVGGPSCRQPMERKRQLPGWKGCFHRCLPHSVLLWREVLHGTQERNGLCAVVSCSVKVCTGSVHQVLWPHVVPTGPAQKKVKPDGISCLQTAGQAVLAASQPVLLTTECHADRPHQDQAS